VSLTLDDEPLCALTAVEPHASMRIAQGQHELCLACSVEEIAVVLNYSSSFALNVDDDFTVEFYKVQREYKLHARKLLDFSRDELPCSSATVERVVTNEKPFGPDFPRSEIVIDESYKKDIVIHTSLIFLTFGIYYVHWVYHTTIFTNYVVSEPERNPRKMALMCFVPFHPRWWSLDTAHRLDKMAIEVGVPSDLEAAWQICSSYAPFLLPTLFQRKINQIVRKVMKKKKNMLKRQKIKEKQEFLKKQKPKQEKKPKQNKKQKPIPSAE
jgi:hypothetical protein